MKNLNIREQEAVKEFKCRFMLVDDKKMIDMNLSLFESELRYLTKNILQEITKNITDEELYSLLKRKNWVDLFEQANSKTAEERREKVEEELVSQDKAFLFQRAREEEEEREKERKRREKREEEKRKSFKEKQQFLFNTENKWFESQTEEVKEKEKKLFEKERAIVSCQKSNIENFEKIKNILEKNLWMSPDKGEGFHASGLLLGYNGIDARYNGRISDIPSLTPYKKNMGSWRYQLESFVIECNSAMSYTCISDIARYLEPRLIHTILTSEEYYNKRFFFVQIGSFESKFQIDAFAQLCKRYIRINNLKFNTEFKVLDEIKEKYSKGDSVFFLELDNFLKENGYKSAFDAPERMQQKGFSQGYFIYKGKEKPDLHFLFDNRVGFLDRDEFYLKKPEEMEVEFEEIDIKIY